MCVCLYIYVLVLVTKPLALLDMLWQVQYSKNETFNIMYVCLTANKTWPLFSLELDLCFCINTP